MESIKSFRNIKTVGLAPWLAATLIFATIVILGSTGTANAALYQFDSITNNNVGDAAIGEAQLSVDVFDDSGLLTFQFFNQGTEDSSITQIYWDDDASVLDGFAVPPGPTSPDAGVSFSIGASPGNLPAGMSITPQFIADYSVGSNPPVQPNGVNPDETLFVPFDYSGEFGAVTDALGAGTLRIGLHVQGFASGGSESFINIPNGNGNGNGDCPVIPEPGSIILGTIGLVSASFLKRRKLV